MVKVKVCGMRDPENVKAVAAVNPDYLGFIFYPQSKRYMGEPDPVVFQQIPLAIQKVAVFVNEKAERIAALSQKYNINMVQLHGSESPSDCETLKARGIQVVKAFGVDEHFEFSVMQPYLAVCDYILLDKKSQNHGGTGLKFNWKIISDYPFDLPFFLSGGISPADVSEINRIKNNRLYAVDINSCFEETPGIKNVKLVKQFIQELKTT